MKATTLVLLGSLCFSAAFSASTSKVENLEVSKDNKIWGGVRSEDGEVPWMVSFHQIDSNSQYHYHLGCNGVIIGNRHILTTATCASQYTKSGSNLGVIAGALSSSGFGGSVHQAIAVTRHENYMPGSSFPENDIAIWEVFPPIEFSSRAYPIALPVQNANLPSDFRVTVAGFGDGPTSTSYLYYGISKKTYVTVVETNWCRTLHPNPEQVTADTLCAGSPNRNCYKDEGGPLYHNGVIYGLIKGNQDCSTSSSVPGLHTKVSVYVDWIRSKTGLYP